jgi:hypothetical protein
MDVNAAIPRFDSVSQALLLAQATAKSRVAGFLSFRTATEAYIESSVVRRVKTHPDWILPVEHTLYSTHRDIYGELDDRVIAGKFKRVDMTVPVRLSRASGRR